MLVPTPKNQKGRISSTVISNCNNNNNVAGTCPGNRCQNKRMGVILIFGLGLVITRMGGTPGLPLHRRCWPGASPRNSSEGTCSHEHLTLCDGSLLLLSVAPAVCYQTYLRTRSCSPFVVNMMLGATANYRGRESGRGRLWKVGSQAINNGDLSIGGACGKEAGRLLVWSANGRSKVFAHFRDDQNREPRHNPTARAPAPGMNTSVDERIPSIGDGNNTGSRVVTVLGRAPRGGGPVPSSFLFFTGSAFGVRCNQIASNAIIHTDQPP